MAFPPGHSSFEGNAASGHAVQVYGNSAPVHIYQAPRHGDSSRSNGSLDEDRNACLRSLCYQSMETRFNTVKNAHRNTCNWLFDAPEFLTWLNRNDLSRNNGILWIKGKPGAGKSTLMKHAVLHCQTNYPDHVLAAHFFSGRGHGLEKNADGLFRSMVCQLVEQSQVICSRFLQLYNTKRRRFGEDIKWQADVLRSFLFKEAGLRQPQPLFLFVDALDECDEKEVRDVMSFLEQLSERAIEAGTSLQICLSSRHYPQISAKSLPLIVEHREGHEQDIRAYVQDQLKVTDDWTRNYLLKKASGVFMWIVLVTKMLNEMYDDGDEEIGTLKQKIIEIPMDLEELFQRILGVNTSHSSETLLLFQWVLFATERLSPIELYVAVLAGANASRLQSLDLAELAPEAITRYILSRSRGLVEIVEDYSHPSKGKSAQFIHESVRDFLFRNGRLEKLYPQLRGALIAESHSQLAMCCLSYLRARKLELRAGRDVTLSPEDIWMLVASLDPLGTYAKGYLLFHAERACEGGVPQQNLLLQMQEYQAMRLRGEVGGSPRDYGLNIWPTPKEDLLYILAGELCLCLLVELLNLSPNLTQQEDLLTQALHVAVCASENGWKKTCTRNDRRANVVKLLLQAGADVNGIEGSMLLAAAKGQRWKGIEKHHEPSTSVVQLLLEAGAGIALGTNEHDDALQAAAGAGDVRSVRLLLAAGAQVNPPNSAYFTALTKAVDASDPLGIMLMITSMNNSLTTIRLLLEAGANVNAVSGPHGNALQTALCKGRHYKCPYPYILDLTKLLLHAGADVHARGRYIDAMHALD